MHAASQKKAEQFVIEHRTWIQQKLAELPTPVLFTDGSIIPVLGKERLIAITHNPDSKITRIRLDDEHLQVNTNRDDPSGRITRFLKTEAKETLTNLAREKAGILEREVAAVQIRDTKSRWGSCGPDGRISLSWRLIFAPWDAMDYVVAHEVAHLIHMNHSRKFWDLCASLSDNYKEGKKWMRNQGNDLMRYG